MSAIGRYLLNWLVLLDEAANTLFGGSPGETISSRAGKARANGKWWACRLCAFLGWVATMLAGKPTDHCAQSIEPYAGSDAVIPDGD
jgi:hypothetical protein